MEPDHLSTPRLQEWLRRTQTPLDVVALATIWLTILPFTPATDTSSLGFWVWGRFLLSLLYAGDLAVRAHLSASPHRYVPSHPLSLAAVLVPPVRIFFSFRLLNAMFRRGALEYFLFVAFMLIANSVVLVYFFERTAPHANILTMGDAAWWAVVTVATVGYGDYYPVTVGGRITAVALMGIGLMTAAVITAQIAASFMEQSRERRRAQATAAGAAAATDAADAADVLTGVDARVAEGLEARLERIEALLRAQVEGRPADPSEPAAPVGPAAPDGAPDPSA